MDCTDLGASGTHTIPLALEPTQLKFGKPLGLTVPMITHGILLSLWRTTGTLETSERILTSIFHSLLALTDCDSLGEFAAVAAEEIRDLYGPKNHILALTSVAKMKLLDAKQLSNTLVSVAMLALEQRLSEANEEEIDVIIKQTLLLIDSGAFGLILEAGQESAALGLIYFLNSCGLIGESAYLIQKIIPQSNMTADAKTRVIAFAGMEY